MSYHRYNPNEDDVIALLIGAVLLGMAVAALIP